MRQVSGQVSMTARQYRRRTCTVDNNHIHLTFMEADFVALLLVTPPHHIALHQTLVEALWPDPDTQALTALNVLSVIAMRLRRKGVPIGTVWGYGYIIPEEARGGRWAPPAIDRRLAA